MRVLYDRRHRRSRDPITALGFQLEEVREQAEMEAVVLADDAGLLVASAGDPAVCEELGAYAPLLLQSLLPTPLPPLLQGGSVQVHPMHLNGQDLFIASLGGAGVRAQFIDRGMQGVRRILAFN